MRYLNKNRYSWLYYANFFLISMTVFLNIYIFTYILTMCSLYYLLNITTILNNNNSLQHLMYNIITFNKFKPLLLTLFLSLSGLPPFFLFFIKFNYLTYVLFSLNPFISFIIFIIFFLNMLYYVQIFFFKTELYQATQFTYKKKLVNYNIVFFIFFILFLILFSIFFITDFIYILKLL